jgi:adenylate cyclase
MASKFEIKLDLDISTIFEAPWTSRDGIVVPSTEDVTLANGAVTIDAVMLYADLAESTRLAREFGPSIAAKIVRAYLSTMTQIVKHDGGHVRSFDGDRVMGVFVGDGKNSSAANCALKMNHAISKILRPKAEAAFPSLVTKRYRLSHCVGIHGSPVLVVRAGVRGDNDLVFIGSAPNLAAKLSELRNSAYHSYMTHSVFRRLNQQAKTSRQGKGMWERVQIKLGSENWACYRSGWSRRP